ncbi:MAG: Glu-tRNA(Gln) amidotransferase subunit GatE [Nanoarchaeota archaeon]|nr:Glu-tRNA(Gln) amidotransferase subunit GatE [Nanoarchaeota archaeon]
MPKNKEGAKDSVDYKKLKFKCGIEIHQQLSGHKLFCNCSTGMNEEKETLQIKRNLRTSASELGEKDIAAEYETRRKRDFIYHCYKGETCLVETDSEPPHNINEQALETALSVVKSLKLTIPDKLMIMRKIVVDGSACSSFQRTLVVGMESENSYIETQQGKVKLTSICLEEDACKIIRQDSKEVNYSLSRQGIPLLEIRTDPDIKNPEHARETAEKLGLILRSFDNIKRGIGTIRQDVNLSILNKSRIEIKGFQDLRSMPKIIENEVKRLMKLKTIRPEVRKANSDLTTTFMRPLPGAARMYPETDLPLIDPRPISKKLRPTELLTTKLLILEEKHHLDSSTARGIIKKKINFEEFIKKYKNLDARTIAYILVEVPKALKTRENLTPSLHQLDTVIAYLDKGVITKEAVPQVLISLSKHKKLNMNQFKKPDTKQIEQELRHLIKNQPDITANALMGILMKKYRGKIPGKELMHLIKKIRG